MIRFYLARQIQARRDTRQKCLVDRSRQGAEEEDGSVDGYGADVSYRCRFQVMIDRRCLHKKASPGAWQRTMPCMTSIIDS